MKRIGSETTTSSQRPVSVISCGNNSGRMCTVKCSIRSKWVSLFVRDDNTEPDYWAHLTPRQARTLAAYLLRASSIIEKQESPTLDGE